MKKWVCTVCGYVYEGEAAPAECPVCHVRYVTHRQRNFRSSQER